MKQFLFIFLLTLCTQGFSQSISDEKAIEITLNHYIDAFYKGDTIALKKALRPRLYKFGYWKNKETNSYDYYAKMTYTDAIAFVQKMKDEGRSRDENDIREVQVLDIANHIASAKVIAAWGVDYMTLSKEGGNWLIEQVIWEGPFDTSYKKNTTSYYLIRHAEKDRSDKSNRNPNLSEAGLRRANNWAKVFKEIDFDLIYSTDYHRTKQTARPTAKAKGLELQFYDPRNMDMRKFLRDTKGKTVLIVGHSNTTPTFANRILGEEKYQQIDDNNNANLYLVTIYNQSKSSNLLVVD